MRPAELAQARGELVAFAAQVLAPLPPLSSRVVDEVDGGRPAPGAMQTLAAIAGSFISCGLHVEGVPGALPLDAAGT
jgi:hypothetical protein